MQDIQVPATQILTSVAVAVRGTILDKQDDILYILSQFIDFSIFYSIEEASRKRFPHLMAHLLASNAVNPMYVAHLSNKTLEEAAVEGDVQIIMDFCRTFPKLVLTTAVTGAIRGGQIQVLNDLVSYGSRVVWGRDNALTAINASSLEAVHWIAARFAITDSNVLLHAIAAKNDEIAQYVCDLFIAIGQYELVGASMSSASLSLAKWVTSRLPIRFVLSLDEPATRGDLPYLNWSRSRETVATTAAMDCAAANGHLDVVVWLSTYRTEGCTKAAIDRAASNGHIDVVKWLCKHRTEGYTDQALFGAATNYFFDTVMWLLRFNPSISCPSNTFDHVCSNFNGDLNPAILLTEDGIGGGSTNAMDWSAAHGSVPLFDYCFAERDEGFTEAAIDGAATNGKLHMIKHLHNVYDAPCTTAAMDNAAANGHADTVKWLHHNRTEGCSENAIQRAALNGDLEMVMWLHNAYPTTSSISVIDAAVKSGSHALVAWLATERQETCSIDGMATAAAQGNFQVLEVLHKYGAARPSVHAFRAAASTHNLYVMGWLAYGFPHVVDVELLEDLARDGIWPPQVLSNVFGFEPRLEASTTNTGCAGKL